MKVILVPESNNRPYVLVSNYLEKIGLHVVCAKKRAFGGSEWQVMGYLRDPRRRLFRENGRLVLDIWPGTYRYHSDSYTNGSLACFDNDYDNHALHIADNLEALCGNEITVRLREAVGQLAL